MIVVINLIKLIDLKSTFLFSDDTSESSGTIKMMINVNKTLLNEILISILIHISKYALNSISI